MTKTEKCGKVKPNNQRVETAAEGGAAAVAGFEFWELRIENER